MTVICILLLREQLDREISIKQGAASNLEAKVLESSLRILLSLLTVSSPSDVENVDVSSKASEV